MKMYISELKFIRKVTKTSLVRSGEESWEIQDLDGLVFAVRASMSQRALCICCIARRCSKIRKLPHLSESERCEVCPYI